MANIMIAPSILSADFGRMGEEVARMKAAGADMIHCDVMDGVFVPNITFGMKMVGDIRKRTDLPLDVHLMIVQPEKYVQRFVEAGADYVTVHYEATSDLAGTLNLIKKCGAKCGAVVSPDTEISVLKEVAPLCDIMLLMSVYPGFGGQKFIPASLARMRELRALKEQTGSAALLEIDGGVNFVNCKEIAEAGAQILVAGNTVFSADNAARAITRLRNV